MNSTVMNIVIDERLDLEKLDAAEFLTMTETEAFKASAIDNKRVFKDYILSSEVFQLDSHLQN